MSAEWFAARLKELRQGAGFTQRQLGERSGVSGYSIAELEQGRYGPTWETALALAKALGVSVADFAEKPRADLRPLGRGRPPKGKATGQAPASKKPRTRKKGNER